MPLFVIGCPQQVDERIFDLTAELLQKFERRDADLGKEGVDIARNEQPHPHSINSLKGRGRMLRPLIHRSASSNEGADSRRRSSVLKPPPEMPQCSIEVEQTHRRRSSQQVQIKEARASDPSFGRFLQLPLSQSVFVLRRPYETRRQSLL